MAWFRRKPEETAGTPKKVSAFVVHADADVQAADAKKHAKDYGLPCPVLLDPTQVLVKRTGVTTASTDFRSRAPRFRGENFDRNMKRVEAVRALAAKKGLTPGQLALAWLLDRGDDIVPIPGTKRRTYLRENVAAANARLTPEDRKYLDEALPPVAGERYSEQAMKMIDRG